MATRNLTFKSSDLGDNVTLLLCFTPPTSDLFVNQFPIAWKVTTLAGKGRSIFNATWTSTLGFCAVQIGNGSLVTAGNYTPINVGETTTLQMDHTTSPPVYHFTDPKALVGVKTVQAVNGTGGPAPIGLGFITDLDTDEEEMHPALTYPNVGAGLAVTGQFTPVLSAYIALDYKQTQMLRADIQSVAPIWSENLISLQQNTTIIVKKNAAGGYEAHQLNASVADDVFDVPSPQANPSFNWYSEQARAYNATLSFSSANEVESSLKALTDHLLSKGYSVKVTIKGAYNTDANLELVLPFGSSINQAEKEVLGVIESHGFPTRAAIKGRAGQVSRFTLGKFSCWADVSPASDGWYSNKAEPKTAALQANGGISKAIEQVISSVGDIALGNGNANGTDGLLAAPAPAPAPASYGKTRTIGRKASAISLAA